MYNRFFGFREKPFKLVPNPAYLFLSRSHQDALAHLIYAVNAGDGFVELTGEVGTGKTTLCRAFLENLDEKAEVAYIFNPVLDPVELLRAVIEEFGIEARGNSVKSLVDILNAFLIEEKTRGKDVILVIDEAQNLTREVLEQIRLISNLETTRSKLLQIILVGQPEFRMLIDSHQLRQLRQRITLSCRLEPLTYQETRDYIEHRIGIASGTRGRIFSRGAIRKIFRFSGGVPRLINIACDRALLTAYGLDQKKIGQNIAATAIKELAGRDAHHRTGAASVRRWAIAAVFSVALIAGAAWYAPGIIDGARKGKAGNLEARTRPPVAAPASPAAAPRKDTRPVPSTAPREDTEPGAIVPKENSGPALTMFAPEPSPVFGKHADLWTLLKQSDPDFLSVSIPKAAESPTEAAVSLEAFLSRDALNASRESSVTRVLELWGAPAQSTRFLGKKSDDLSFIRVAAQQHGLAVFHVGRDLDLILSLGLPAVMPFDIPRKRSRAYLVLNGFDGEKFLLTAPGQNRVVHAAPEAMAAFWSKSAYIPWNDFFALRGTIPLDAAVESVITLKLLLRDLGFEEIALNPTYDVKTVAVIRRIQADSGLPVDGVVGPLTKIVLYNRKSTLKIPRLVGTRFHSDG